jgi:hypothetical protein
MDNFTQGGWRKTLATLLPFLAVAFALLVPQATAQDTSLEKIEDEDPWTKGDPELLKKLGIVRVGAMPWTQTHASDGVVKTLGGIPVIFIETEHFRLASTLESYRPTGDRAEKERLEAEFAALKKLCNKFTKLPPKIDPWLRAHLYAYRIERVYDQFTTAFGIKDADFESALRKTADGRSLGQGPYLGQKNKFTVLLTQSQSSMGRYLRANFQIEPEYSFRSAWPDGYLLAMNYEALKNGGRELDLAMHVAHGGCARPEPARRVPRLVPGAAELAALRLRALDRAPDRPALQPVERRWREQRPRIGPHAHLGAAGARPHQERGRHPGVEDDALAQVRGDPAA